MSGPELERKRKKIIETFKKYGLAITIKPNLFVVNFLDIQFNLLNGTFKSYRKPNNDPIYVHKDSNHPPQVLKELPKTVGKRISTISSSKEIFESSKIEYENALKIIGYKDRLVYENSSVNENDKNENKKRKRNIIWYNPPYSANVKTKTGKISFKPLNKHFPRRHKFNKIFNKNTVKLSCSSTKNMASLIATHNRSILNPNDQVYGCNCRVRNDCHLQYKCLTSGIVYQKTLTNNNDDAEKIYYGLCETTFKERYRNHTSPFRHDKNRDETKFSNYIWELRKIK